MNRQMLSVLLMCAVSVFWYSAALGQTPTKNSSPTISAVALVDGVRITAPSSAVQMRVEIYEGGGTKVWDSDIRGNVFDWHVQNGAGERLSVGDYACVVTVKNLAGKVTQRAGSIHVGENDLRVGGSETARMSALQSQAIGPLEEDASWTTLDEQQNQTTTVIAHDGADGEITRGRGAFSFRLGDFYSGNSQEQMRLSEEGNLGIGTAKPEFKLDVMGAIRARSGFVFNDGSTLNVNDQGVLTRTSVNGNITPNVAGIGGQGRLAKWTDNAGTLGESVIAENAGSIGIGNPNPDSLVNIQGAIPALLGKMVVIRSTGSNNGFGLQMDAVGAGNNALGLAVNGVPRAAFSWDNSRKFLGLVNFAYSGNDFALRLNVDGSLTYHDGVTSAELLRVTKDGNVGIGVNPPLQKLHIVSGATDIRFGGPFSPHQGLPAPGMEIKSNSEPSIFLTDTGNNGRSYRIGNWTTGLVFTDETFGTSVKFLLDPSGNLVTFGALNLQGPFFGSGLSREGGFFDKGVINFGINTGREQSFEPSLDGYWLRADQRDASKGFHFFKKAQSSGTESELVTIDGAGNLGIGTPSPVGNLHINIPSLGTPINAITVDVQSFQTLANASASYYFKAHNFGSGQPAAFLIRGDGLVGIGTNVPNQLLTVNGDASKAGGGLWNIFSDERLKNIKGPFTSGLKAVMRLQPIRYEYKPNNALDIKSEGEHIGFSAQSVQKIIPEAVVKDNQGYLLIKGDPIMWAMLNAIKEQQAIIVGQQKQIDDLKKSVSRLRREVRK